MNWSKGGPGNKRMRRSKGRGTERLRHHFQMKRSEQGCREALDFERRMMVTGFRQHENWSRMWIEA